MLTLRLLCLLFSTEKERALFLREYSRCPFLNCATFENPISIECNNYERLLCFLRVFGLVSVCIVSMVGMADQVEPARED